MKVEPRRPSNRSSIAWLKSGDTFINVDGTVRIKTDELRGTNIVAASLTSGCLYLMAPDCEVTPFPYKAVPDEDANP
jgi:hypothetical protein